MKVNTMVKDWVDSYSDWFLEEGSVDKGKMTNNLYPYDKMFSPIKINRTTIKNRIVMAPMGNISMCEETGRPSNKMLQYFYERAKGGVGLITTGLIPVSHGIDNSITELGKLSYFPRIDRSRTIFMGWRNLAEGVHAYGSKIFVQLTPGLGRVGNPQCLITMKKFPQSASLNPNFYIPEIPCLPFTDGQLKKIVKNMGQASADSKSMGLDGVYLHGHEGYLLEQMTNPAFNRRALGRYSDWQKFGIDCVTEMRRRVGPNYPIMYRIDLTLALNETYDVDTMNNKSLHKFQNGRSVKMTLEYMENLVKAGVDIFDVDLGCYDNWWLPHPPASMPPGCFLPVSDLVKRYFKKKNILSNAGVEVPVVAVGKLGYPDLAEQALRDEKADMIMLGRPLLADPEWCNKAYAGKVKDIRPCIGCQEGCINEFVEGGHPQCAVNPRTAFEHEFPATLEKVDKPKKIAVIGGGPAGVMTSTIAAKRGHNVTLFDESPKLGGKIISGSVPKIKFELDNYREYLEREVAKSVENDGLKYKPSTRATISALKKGNYDTIVFAVGAKSMNLAIAGLDKIRNVDAVDLLLNPEKIEDAKNIVVVGGGVVGCETAEWLVFEKNLNVKIVEMDKYFMNHVCTANRGHLIYNFKNKGVELMNCTKVVEFTPESVKVMQNISKTVPDPYMTWHPILPENIENPLATKLKLEEVEKVIPADLVVMAAGVVPDDSLYYKALSKHTAPLLYNIGDSFESGKVLEATRAAYRLAVGL
ncbi:MAG: FAD-dependent oxidoreductase [Peptostreptococcaceae bacterium]|nr:FAD-dependent oxidoreductase [Peptostreptococcaceae bacterium]